MLLFLLRLAFRSDTLYSSSLTTFRPSRLRMIRNIDLSLERKLFPEVLAGIEFPGGGGEMETIPDDRVPRRWGEDGDYTRRYTVTTTVTPALTWASM